MYFKYFEDFTNLFSKEINSLAIKCVESMTEETFLLRSCSVFVTKINKLANFRKKRLITLQKVINKLYFFTYTFMVMNSNKDIFDRAIGRPAMMGFMFLVGTYLVTGQLIPGWF